MPSPANQPPIVIDIRKDVPDLMTYVEQRVEHQLTKARSRNKTVKMIDFGFEFGQANWVALTFDTRENAAPDGEWTMHIRSVMFRRRNWPIWHRLARNQAVHFVDLSGAEIDVMEDPDTLVCGIIGEALKYVLLTARDRGVFEPLPKSDRCELGVENLEGFFGWPVYEDRWKDNLA